MPTDSIFRGAFLVYCLEAGFFLLATPWFDAWGRTCSLLPYGGVRDLLLSTWVRAAISGFGLIHLVWGAHDLDLLLRRRRPGGGASLEDPSTPRDL